MAALSVVAVAAVGLAWISARRGDPWLMFGCLFAGAIARAFHQPIFAARTVETAFIERFVVIFYEIINAVFDAVDYGFDLRLVHHFIARFAPVSSLRVARVR